MLKAKIISIIISIKMRSSVPIIYIVISSHARSTFIKFTDINDIAEESLFYAIEICSMREEYFNYILELNSLNTKLNYLTSAAR